MLLLDLLTSKSGFVNEKKATSVPDIKADKNSNISKVIVPVTNDQFIEIIKNILEGSGSNYIQFN